MSGVLPLTKADQITKSGTISLIFIQLLVPDKLTVYDNQLQGTVTSNYLANLVFL
jgi:hypothetical protein